MVEEWKIVHNNICSDDSNNSYSDDSDYEQSDSGEIKDTVPLLDFEKNMSKDRKNLPLNSSKKRIRRVDYVITGSGFLERKKRKRQKINDNNYVNINIVPNSRQVFRPRGPVWIFTILLFVVLSFTIFAGYVMVYNDYDYHYYNNIKSINSTLLDKD